MTKPIKITLIACSGAIGTGLISFASYVKGKRDGIKLGKKEVTETHDEAPRNTRREQPSA